MTADINTNTDTAPVLVIDRLMWSLRSIYPKDDSRYGLCGISVDHEYAVATDGSCLVAHRKPEGCAALPKGWLLHCLWPNTIPEDATAECPVKLGVHAVTFTRPGGFDRKAFTKPALVEIVQGGDFPNWRQVLPPRDEMERDAEVHRFSADLVWKMANACANGGRPRMFDLVPGSRQLAPAVMRYQDSIGILMPVRKG